MEKNSFVDASFIAACINGQRENVQELFNSISSCMYPVCLNYCHSEYEADKMMVKGFLKILSELKKYKQGKSLDAWCSGILHTYINNEFLSRQPYMKMTGIDISLSCTLN